jgi:UDP-N-acetyl-D-glucosamine dehydrogenase
VVEKIQNALNDRSKPLKGSRIHIIGVAYKKNIEDMRESPALDIMLLLKQRGAVISYVDPHVPTLKIDGLDLVSASEDALAAADCAVIVTDHAAFDYPRIVQQAQLVVDTRNACKNLQSANVVRL